MDFTNLSKTISVNLKGDELDQFQKLHANGIRATAIFRRGLKLYESVYEEDGIQNPEK